MPSRESKNNPPVFTQRERTILNLVAEGYESREIADQLYISEKTVRQNHMNLMKKLNAQNISSIIDRALKKGLINPYEVLESRFSKRKTKAS